MCVSSSFLYVLIWNTRFSRTHLHAVYTASAIVYLFIYSFIHLFKHFFYISSLSHMAWMSLRIFLWLRTSSVSFVVDSLLFKLFRSFSLSFFYLWLGIMLLVLLRLHTTHFRTIEKRIYIFVSFSLFQKRFSSLLSFFSVVALWSGQ